MKKSSNSFRAIPDGEASRDGGFNAAWWCRGPHAQTLWAPLFRWHPRVHLRRERLELPDGDFVDLDWGADRGTPVVIILHGLEGNSGSHYARGMSAALQRYGMRPVVMHFRGCSGQPNRLTRGYHAGDTADLAFLVKTLRERCPDTLLAAIGYSLGGNVLLKWLGETGDTAGLHAAAAVSVPFVLQDSARQLNIGWSRLYRYHLLATLRRSLRRKFHGAAAPFRAADAAAARTFQEFDDAVTAPLHGFANAEYYYSSSSSRSYLRHIAVPTLVVHAADDPFLSCAAIPAAHELSPQVVLEVHEHGGHVGFIAGDWPWLPHFWLEERIPQFLTQQMGPATSCGTALPDGMVKGGSGNR
ncbi:MAG: hydrolase [Acidiferrobacterales bacterium]